MADTEDLRAGKLFNVQGYVAVVTGGGSGIGLMAAQALAANGARVYITGRRADALERAAKWHDPVSNGSHSLGGSIIAAKTCDVTDKASLEALVEHISSERGEQHIDLLVTAAGISGPKTEPEPDKATALRDRLWQEDVDEWDSVMRADVSSVFFTTVAFLPLLQAGSEKRGHLTASVLVISSMSGIMRHAQGHFSYNAAKGGTVHLAKLLSKEIQKAGIRVNSIAPGYFPSEMTASESDERQKSSIADDKIREKGHVPAGRSGNDQDMAMGVLFLARNSYVNGEILAIDGGVLNEISGR